MHQEDIISRENDENNVKVKRTVKSLLIIVVCMVPSIILSIYLFSQIKSPDKSDFEYAKIIWNDGIENIAYKNMVLDIDNEDVNNFKYDGYSNLADTNSTLDITLENGDLLKFRGYKVEVLSRFILGNNTSYYTMDFSKESVPISRTIMPLVFDIMIWLFVFAFFSVTTFIIICIATIIIDILIESISNRKKI